MLRMPVRRRVYFAAVGRARFFLCFVLGLSCVLLPLGAVTVRRLLQHSVRPAIEAALNMRVGAQLDLAVRNAVYREDMNYEDLVNITRSDTGEVLSVTMNTDVETRIISDVCNDIGEIGGEEEPITVYLPLGTLLGSQYFAGCGPRIPIRFMAFSNSSVILEESFVEMGINQTLYKIELNACLTYTAILPLMQDEHMTVTEEIPLAQTLIVGEVPSVYVGK